MTPQPVITTAEKRGRKVLHQHSGEMKTTSLLKKSSNSKLCIHLELYLKGWTQPVFFPTSDQTGPLRIIDNCGFDRNSG